VSAFIRLNPLRSVPVSVFEEHATVVDQGLVFYIDLRKPLDEIWAQTRPNHRRDIARLIRLGYVVQMDDWSAYSTFRRVYRMTMRRRSAAKSYYLSDRYFDELHEKLADHLHLCIVRAPTGEVAAGGLFVFAADVADYHLGGTADGHLRRAPSKLMFDFARRWAKQRGASILNLGGGIGGSPGSLEHFKKGFTRAGARRFTARFIFDEESYIQLTAAARNHGLVDESPDAFFPAYRQVYAAAAR
jgi:lipid II:glycine glycyltransferase (peptidoglycan interpeptide bridge formation enzyme)